MTFPRAMALMSVFALAGLSEAQAQSQWPPVGQTAPAAAQSNPFPPPPGQQSNPFPPPPGQSQAAPSQSSPFPPPPGQRPSPFPATPGQASQSPARASPFPPAGGARSVCEQFPAIRGQAEKDASAIKAASDRKAARAEVCALFKKFAVSESKMAKFLETNQSACGVPPDAIKQVKSQHAKTLQIRNNVCSAGPAARGPSLSDALGGPILPDEKPKPGRGTFDTLTGSPLAR